MENLIIAVVLSALIIIFTIFNSFYLCNTCDEIIRLIDNKQFPEARDLWEKKRNYISLFIRDGEIDLVDSEIQALEQSLCEGDDLSYMGTKFKEAVYEILHSEKPSFFNIF